MYVSMKNMLADANANNYAVMAINCFNIETARSVITAAETANAPIIINIFYEHLLEHCDSGLITPIVKSKRECGAESGSRSGNGLYHKSNRRWIFVGNG